MSVSYITLNNNYDMDINPGSSGFQVYFIDCSSNSVNFKLTGSDAFDGSTYGIIRTDTNNTNNLVLSSYDTVNHNNSINLPTRSYTTCYFMEQQNDWWCGSNQLI